MAILLNGAGNLILGPGGGLLEPAAQEVLDPPTGVSVSPTNPSVGDNITTGSVIATATLTGGSPTGDGTWSVVTDPTDGGNGLTIVKTSSTQAEIRAARNFTGADQVSAQAYLVQYTGDSQGGTVQGGGDLTVTDAVAAPSAITSSAGTSLSAPDNTLADSVLSVFTPVGGAGDGSYSLTVDDLGKLEIVGNELVLGENLADTDIGTDYDWTVQYSGDSAGGDPITLSGTVAVTDHTAVSVLATVSVTYSEAVTNEPVQIPVWVGPDSGVSGSESLGVIDADGVSVACQVDNEGRARNGNMCLALLSLAPRSGTGTEVLRVIAAGSKPSATPAIDASDVLATDFQCKVTLRNLDGSGDDYAADARAALGGSTTWAKDDDYLADDWVSGPYRRTFVCCSPVRRVGDDAVHESGNGMHVWFEVDAWCTAGGTITDVRWAAKIENTFVEHIYDTGSITGSVVQTGNSYDLLIEVSTALDDDTLITATDDLTGASCDWDAPETIDCSANTITLSAASNSYGVITVDRASGVWPSNVIGAGIRHSAGGLGTVHKRVNDTRLAIWSGQAFSGTSLTTGTLYLQGQAQQRFHRHVYEGWIGSAPKHVWLYGEHADAFSPTTKAHADHLIATKAMMNYQTAFADASPADLSSELVTTAGRRAAVTWTSGDSGLIFTFDSREPNTGNRPDIGVMPGQILNAVLKPNANGRRMLKLAPVVAGSSLRHFREVATGAILRPDSPTFGSRQYHSNPGTGLTPEYRINLHFGQMAHHPDFYWAPYLHFGRLWQLEEAMCRMMWHFSQVTGSRQNGGGVNRLVGAENEYRGVAWWMRDYAHLLAMLPGDSNRASLYEEKATMLTLYQSSLDWIQGIVDDTAPTYSADPDYRYVAGGPHWLIKGGGDTSDPNDEAPYAPWQSYYNNIAYWHVTEVGQAEEVVEALHPWTLTNAIDGLNQLTGDPNWVICDYYRSTEDGGALLKTWEEQYAASGNFLETDESTGDGIYTILCRVAASSAVDIGYAPEIGTVNDAITLIEGNLTAKSIGIADATGGVWNIVERS